MGAAVDDQLGTDLLDLAARLVAIPSVSHHEADLAGFLVEKLAQTSHLEVERIKDTVVARTNLGRPRRLVLAGHIDTVPSFSGSDSYRIEQDTLWGLGAVDMKGGIAILLALALAVPEPAVDLTYIFYACEEVEHVHNSLANLARERPELIRGDAAVLCEPTAGLVEAGCQGTMRVEIRLAGRRAHTARPYEGLNALHRMAPVLAAISAYSPRQVMLDGCVYTEQVQAVRAHSGISGNVVPDRAELTVNVRFAPDRSPAEAQTALRSLLGDSVNEDAGDEIEVVDVAPASPPALDHPLLSAIVAGVGEAPRGKVGWTDVATFWAAGVPATNFGPGDPRLAHTPNEHVSRRELERVHKVLHQVVAGS